MAIELVRPLPQAGVLLAYCHNGKVESGFTECYTQLLLKDASSRHLIKGKSIARGLYVPGNRNMIVRQFLRETKLDWLFFVDTDMLFEASQFHDLYDAAVENRCDVLGGLYYGYQGDGYIYPTWLEENLEKGSQETVARRTGGIQDVATIGMGFTFIHRRVLEALRDVKPNHNWAWFAHDDYKLPTGEIDCMGEDTTFCHRARALGFKIQGHSGVALGHEKWAILTWEKFDQEQAIRRALQAKEKESA